MKKLLQEINDMAVMVPQDLDGDKTERTVIGHVDDEKHMVRKRLYNLSKYAQELDAMVASLPDDADFPGWWQDKVTLADKCLSKAKHYLESELAVPDTDETN